MSLKSGALSSIPDDILCELYAILADVDPPRRDGRPTWEDHSPSLVWLKLTHVCRRLRLLGLELPHLWGRIVCILPRACKIILVSK